MKKLPFLITTIIMGIPIIAAAAVIHVPADFPTIQAGIDAALEGDTVLVADGIYTGEGNRDISFLGKAITVISENGAENCVIDCEGEGRGFLFTNNETEDSILQGFTIQNGYTSSDGGGILCGQSSPRVVNCIIQDNIANNFGGGILCHLSSAIIANCLIQNNINYANGDDAYGGGLCALLSSITVINCTFTNNSVVGIAHLATEGWGGGLYLNDTGQTSTNVVINSTVYGNHAYEGDHGGIFCGSFTEITNCILWANEPDSLAHYGSIDVTFSDVQLLSGVWPGEGNINLDPHFCRSHQ